MGQGPLSVSSDDELLHLYSRTDLTHLTFSWSSLPWTIVILMNASSTRDDWHSCQRRHKHGHCNSCSILGSRYCGGQQALEWPGSEGQAAAAQLFDRRGHVIFTRQCPVLTTLVVPTGTVTSAEMQRKRRSKIAVVVISSVEV
jgi:hypothetical protein